MSAQFREGSAVYHYQSFIYLTRFQNGWPEALSYKSAGVDIGAGDALVDAIKPFAKVCPYSLFLY